LLPFSLLVLIGCQLCHPETGPGTNQSAAAPAPVRPGVLPITPQNASFTFTGATALISHDGHFAAFDGLLEMPTPEPRNAKIRVVVDMDSTTTRIGLLTKHLKGPDFFDVAQYPKAEFVSEAIAPTSDASAYQVTGKLTFHGVQKTITFPARIRVTAGEVTFDGTLVIRQTEFGMAEAARKTKDEVPVHVTFHCRRG
jgi:polyisoprenoid-binding protein YceI